MLLIYIQSFRLELSAIHAHPAARALCLVQSFTNRVSLVTPDKNANGVGPAARKGGVVLARKESGGRGEWATPWRHRHFARGIPVINFVSGTGLHPPKSGGLADSPAPAAPPPTEVEDSSPPGPRRSLLPCAAGERLGSHRIQGMDTSGPSAFVNGEFMRRFVGRRVRTVVQAQRDEGGLLVGLSADGYQLTIKGASGAPTSHYVEVIGIAENNQTINAEVWTDFGKDFDPAPFHALCILANEHARDLFL
ncbi:hypothetical protein GUJ93_ZPchr0008g12494 [Zizania palustris]|uniref:Uncharacterized protein n=1 Tax=Zizania palustris TaxID=103762 RepID=A0A8J5VIL6_ZIZPA|nr:hypothetical protein GUJ93_ZPchr0008g12494 [Zizania palustris]